MRTSKLVGRETSWNRSHKYFFSSFIKHTKNIQQINNVLIQNIYQSKSKEKKKNLNR